VRLAATRGKKLSSSSAVWMMPLESKNQKTASRAARA